MRPHLLVITGVSGTGKSTTLTHLKRSLTSQPVRLRELDESGVPTGVDDAWRRCRARMFLAEACGDAVNGLSTVVAGSLQPADFGNTQLPVRFCVLEASPRSIRQRLLECYSDAGSAEGLMRAVGLSPERFAAAIEAAQPGFLAQFECSISEPLRIDTTNESSEAVASRVLDWILAAA